MPQFCKCQQNIIYMIRFQQLCGRQTTSRRIDTLALEAYTIAPLGVEMDIDSRTTESQPNSLVCGVCGAVSFGAENRSFSSKIKSFYWRRRTRRSSSSSSSAWWCMTLAAGFFVECVTPCATLCALRAALCAARCCSARARGGQHRAVRDMDCLAGLAMEPGHCQKPPTQDRFGI